jgi:GT2 family glycosyltransferase
MNNSQNFKEKISIVSVTYNSNAVIRSALSNIKDFPNIFVVDNASEDNTCQIIEAQFPHVKLIKSPMNIGFGRGNNLALEQITTEYALLLNPDSIIKEKDIEALITIAEKYDNAAIIAPILKGEDGSIHATYKNNIFVREKYNASFVIPDGDLCADFLSGAVLLLKMSYFKQIGFFDPRIFLFYEDDDLALRVRKAGYSLVLTTQAEAMHLVGKSSPSSEKIISLKNWHMAWSRIYIESKYFGARSAKKMAIKIFLQALLKSFVYYFTNRDKYIKYEAQYSAALQYLFDKTS